MNIFNDLTFVFIMYNMDLWIFHNGFKFKNVAKHDSIWFCSLEESIVLSMAHSQNSPGMIPNGHLGLIQEILSSGIRSWIAISHDEKWYSMHQMHMQSFC